MQTNAAEWIRALNMQAHPEGGYYAPAFRSGEQMEIGQLPDRYKGPRDLWSSIYFMVTQDHFSAFHRIQTDELWHYYQGDHLVLHVIHPGTGYQRLLLGPDIQQGARLQQLVKRGSWFAASVPKPGNYTLAGCTLAPGFSFEDFEMGIEADLLVEFPEYASIIRKFCRQ